MQELLASSSMDHLIRIVVSTVAVFIAVITYTRIAGLRSFSKMSSFEFAMTIAIGSLIATVAVVQVPLIEGLVALAVLFLTQVLIALFRQRTYFKHIVDNTPVLLMKDGEMLRDNMKQTRVMESDIRSKLRGANVKSIDDVQAVVLETTGDITVLHGRDTLSKSLLDDIET